MAAVLRPDLERQDFAALDELEALKEAISSERARLNESHRRWLIQQAALATPIDPVVNRDIEYITLLEKQNALLKQRIGSLEDINRKLLDEKSRVLQATEPLRPIPAAPPPATTSILSTELTRLSEQCRQLRRTEESHLRDLSAKDHELNSLRIQLEEMKLTLRAKEEDIVQLTHMKTEAAGHARRVGENEFDRVSEERRKAVEELISAKAALERLQRDHTATQQELRAASGDLREARIELSQKSAQLKEVEESLRELSDAGNVGNESTRTIAEKVSSAALVLRRARADLATEQTKRQAAEQEAKEKTVLVTRRAEAEDRVRAELDDARKQHEERVQQLCAQLAEAKEQGVLLQEQLSQAEASLATAEKQLNLTLQQQQQQQQQQQLPIDPQVDESAIAEHAALEELLGEAQARVAELEAREALHEDEVKSARQSQQMAQIALREQLAQAEAALSEERASVAKLTSERERLWREAAAKQPGAPAELQIPRGAGPLDKERLFAQLQEVFYAEACQRLLRQ